MDGFDANDLRRAFGRMRANVTACGGGVLSLRQQKQLWAGVIAAAWSPRSRTTNFSRPDLRDRYGAGRDGTKGKCRGRQRVVRGSRPNAYAESRCLAVVGSMRPTIGVIFVAGNPADPRVLTDRVLVLREVEAIGPVAGDVGVLPLHARRELGRGPRSRFRPAAASSASSAEPISGRSRSIMKAFIGDLLSKNSLSCDQFSTMLFR